MCKKENATRTDTHTHATFFLFYKHVVTTAHSRASDRTEAVTATRKDEGGAGNILKEPAEPSGASRRRHGVVAML